MQHNLAGYRKRTLNLFFYEMKCQPNMKKKEEKRLVQSTKEYTFRI